MVSSSTLLWDRGNFGFTTGCPGRERKQERWVATAVILAVTTLLQGGWVGFLNLKSGWHVVCVLGTKKLAVPPPPWVLLIRSDAP
jgi:hypothetical protein